MVSADTINAYILTRYTDPDARMSASNIIQAALDKLVIHVSCQQVDSYGPKRAANEMSSTADYGFDDVLEEVDDDEMVDNLDELRESTEEVVKDTMYAAADFIRALNGEALAHMDTSNV